MSDPISKSEPQFEEWLERELIPSWLLHDNLSALTPTLRVMLREAFEAGSAQWREIVAEKDRQLAEMDAAIREVWPHLTGHCFEGATPECFAKMRDTLSAVVPNLPYASGELRKR